MNSIRNIQQNRYKKYTIKNWERKEKLRRLNEICNEKKDIVTQELLPTNFYHPHLFLNVEYL